MAFDPDVFLLEEYKALRKEIEIFLAESRSLERYTIFALAILWGWLITHQIDNKAVWALPVVITSASALRRMATSRHYGELRRYIATIEDKYHIKGWENRKPVPWNIGFTENLISLVLLVVSIAALVLRTKLIHK
jgi:hypothetical protein